MYLKAPCSQVHSGTNSLVRPGVCRSLGPRLPRRANVFLGAGVSSLKEARIKNIKASVEEKNSSTKEKDNGVSSSADNAEDEGSSDDVAPQVIDVATLRSEAAEVEARIRDEVLEVAAQELKQAYAKDLRYTARNILLFRKVGDTFEWLSLALSALGSITAFLAGVNNGDKWLAFASGATGSVALAIAAVGRYCNSQSKERTLQLNKLLSHFGLRTYPDVVVEFSAGDLEAMAAPKSDGDKDKCKCKDK